MTAAEQNAQNQSNMVAQKLAELGLSFKRAVAYVGIALGFFLLGFLPMWIKANTAIEQRDAAQKEVRLNQIRDSLSSAMIDVQRDDYEPARQHTSTFYTNLRNEIDRGDRSVFITAQREKLRQLLSERDEVITLLARSDPSAADRLFGTYSSFKKLLNTGG